MKSLLLVAMFLGLQDSGTFSGHTREVSSVAISPDGKHLASGSVDLTVRIWDVATKKSVAVLEGHDGDVQSLAFSPDGKLLASGEMYKKLKIWDVASRKETQMFTDSEGKLKGLVFSNDSKRIFAACDDNSARVWLLGSQDPAKKLAHNYAVNAIAMSPDGKTVVTADDGGSIHFWDSTIYKEVKTLKHGSSARSVAFSGDGKTLASGGGDVVKLWDVATGTEKASAKAEANSVAICPDGSIVVVGTQDNQMIFLNATDLSVKAKYEKHERPVTCVAVSPDGKFAYSSSMDYTLKSWPLK